MSLRSPTEHENGGISLHRVLPSTRHSRARGNPGLFCAELAWIPAFAGTTEPSGLFVLQIIPAYVFSKEDTKSTKFKNGLSETFASFVTFVVRGS